MKYSLKKCTVAALLIAISAAMAVANEESAPVGKPGAHAALTLLREGNARFAEGQTLHGHQDAARIKLASQEDQGKYAYATVLSCSDSRVPVELLFDTGIMEVFVVRVAGNVCDTDEIGSIEYGLGHVKTPLLVVLGHTQCGAVKAVLGAAHGDVHELEANIPPLIENINAPVKRAMAEHPKAEGAEMVGHAVRENVWQSIDDLFTHSAAVRELVKQGKVRVVGAIYALETGTVEWLPEEKVAELLAAADAKAPATAPPAKH
ncbi:MAG: carbonic anhydrase [FCB group bacterium]|jgi:carbonic anhydrase|nr:carbonic anhydrase [FCB group bacterium]